MKKMFVLIVAVTVVACRPSPVSPSERDLVRFTVQISQTTITAAATATVTFRLENRGSDAVRLSFGSSCQVLVYITSRPSGQVVYPSGGGWVCLTVTTELTIAAGASTTTTVVVRAAGAPFFADVALPPGEYAAYARLDDTIYKLTSESVSFVVQ